MSGESTTVPVAVHPDGDHDPLGPDGLGPDGLGPDGLGSQGPADSPWLAGCDPSVVLAVVVAVPVVLVRAFDPGPLLVLWCLAVFAVLTATGLRPGRLALAQLPFVSFGLSLVLVNAVTRDGTVLLSLGLFEVTDEGLRMGAALAVRTLVIGVVAAGFLAVTDPARLLVSLHQVAHLPVRVTYALLAAFRLLDDLPAEWTTIRRAYAVRQPARPGGDGRRRLDRSPAALARAAFVLLATSIRRAERIAVSLESRGLGAVGRSGRTSWRQARVTRRDGVLVVVVASALAVVVGWAPIG